MNNILKGFAIPPQPKVVLEIDALLDKPNVNASQIAALIGKDASLTAQILKMANSSLYSRGRAIDSIGQALSVIGLGNFKTIVLKGALCQAFSQSNRAFFEIFWRHSELVSLSCEIIAKRCAPELAQSAYIFGLFHDCALPLMVTKYPDYLEILKRNLDYEPNIISIEEELYSTNHATIGFFFAKSWRLPEVVCSAIDRHHAEHPSNPFGYNPEEILISILMVSEYITYNFGISGSVNPIGPEAWLDDHGFIADILRIAPDNIRDFQDDLLDEAFSA